MRDYQTVFEQSEGKYEEKRSVFIAELFHCETPEDAAKIVTEQKSKYWDARHVVSAYRLLDGTVKASDDGEPHGTSGKPVLDLITGADLFNVIITVTRYFGGVLLGTGGLVRAYSASAKQAIENAKIVKMKRGYLCKISCDYQQYQLIERLLYSNDVTIKNSEFEDRVNLEIIVPFNSFEGLKDKITETFSGKISLNYEKELFFVKK